MKELKESGPECLGFVEGTYRSDAFLDTGTSFQCLGKPWWYPELPPEEPWLCGAFISNANILTLDDPETLCPMYGNWWNRALLCKVYKAKPEELQMLPFIKS